MEGSELFRDAEKYLKNNPGKDLGDYGRETGYSGPALKRRNRRGQGVRVSYKGKSADAQTRRARLEKPKTEAEAAYVRSTRRAANRRSQSTLHQQAYGGRPSVAEHDVRLASGGTNEAMSISDPDFAAFKTTVESKAPKDVVIDIDDVSGELRAIPKRSHNKFQPTSQQPGINLNPGDDILGVFRQMSRFKAGRSLLSALPVVGLRFGAADASARTVEYTQTKNPTDALQASLAAAGLTPGLGFIPDLANLVIDLYRARGSHNRIRGRSGAQKAQQGG